MPKRPIDLKAVREARRRLRQLAKEHPELTGPLGPQNRAGWEAELQEDERMSGTRMVSFRLPEELVDRIDALAARRSEAAGVPGAVGRVDIVKLALQSGLEAMEASGPRPAKKRKK
jgi:predicted DNA-binding protein